MCVLVVCVYTSIYHVYIMFTLLLFICILCIYVFVVVLIYILCLMQLSFQDSRWWWSPPSHASAPRNPTPCSWGPLLAAPSAFARTRNSNPSSLRPDVAWTDNPTGGSHSCCTWQNCKSQACFFQSCHLTQDTQSARRLGYVDGTAVFLEQQFLSITHQAVICKGQLPRLHARLGCWWLTCT